MKVTDFIIEFLIGKNVKHIFGYPGGVICHLIDSATKYEKTISVHTNYHEQASAFSACGYAQESKSIGIAFATSGPGALNLVTGIANAYYDAIPTLFLTGQVDTYALKGDLQVRQRGFQETDIVAVVTPITKYTKRIDDPKDIVYELEKAFFIAMTGNPGPVLLDLPADVQRAEIQIDNCRHYVEETYDYMYEESIVLCLEEAIKKSKRPCLLVGNGVKQSGNGELINEIIDSIGIPTVFSLPAFDILPYKNKYNFGFIGANGHRYANFVLGKSDLIITIGSRLDLKQVGNLRDSFASQAHIIRIDVDNGNLSYKVHADETTVCIDAGLLLRAWKAHAKKLVESKWVSICSEIKAQLKGIDDCSYTCLISKFCELIPEDTIMTLDVGQNQVWVAQQIQLKDKQNVYMSSGLGAMGYSLPASIGCYYASGKKVISFSGDGGIQMNIQELQFISRERLPIKIVVINNNALGMIRGFQENNFDKNYSQTIVGRGYSAPKFEKIAEAYDFEYYAITKEEDINQQLFLSEFPAIIEIKLSVETQLVPNFGRTGMIQDQLPYIQRDLYNYIMSL